MRDRCELCRNLRLSVPRRTSDQSKGTVVDIRIGILNAPRELSFESAQTAAEISEQVASALSNGTAFLKLTDNKGKLFIVPTAGIAYVEVGTEESRRVGFVG
jgi:Protein of unknown function (DUF3107)